MVQQLQPQSDIHAFEGLLIVIVVLFLYQRYRKACSKRRLNAVRNRAQPCIPEQKVIIALELQGLFVDISSRKIEYYSKIELKNTGVAHLVAKVKELFGIGVYYRPKTSLKSMRTLLQLLQSNPKIELYLYTHLSKQIASQILSQTTLSPFFPPEYCRSSFQRYNQSLKHPTEVDSNTKRVIIVTNTRDDYLQEHSKYFLLVKNEELSESLRLLNSIVEKNGDIDELHNELSEAKQTIDTQHDY